MKFRTLTRILLMANGTRIVFDCATEACVINADATGFAGLIAGSARGAVF